MKEKIKILILDNSFTFGGAINSLCILLRAIDKEKFVPILVSGQSRDFLSKNFTCTWYHFVPRLPWVNNQIYHKFLAFPIFRLRFFRIILNNLRFIYWLIFITIPESIKYYQLGRKHKVDAIHLNNIFGSQLAGILASKLLRVPCIAHLRDFEEINFVTKSFSKFIDHHIAISSAIRSNLLMLGVPDKNISIIYDAVDMNEFSTSVSSQYLIDEFGIKEKQQTFGIFGRIIDWKGIREFVLAAEKVIKEIPEAKAFIVGSESDGDKEYVEKVKTLVKKLNLQDRVIFTGFREDVSALMKIMDVIVHASTKSEPFGMVLIEGMAMEKPIVATKAGGPLDIVDENETGFLVDCYDYRTMSRNIISLLNDSGMAREMGRKGKRKVIDLFTKERYASEIENAYDSLIEKTELR